VNKPNQVYRFGDLEVDVTARRVLRNGTPVPLTPKSFELLQVLVENRERALSKSELLAAVWPDAQVEEGNVPFQISVLRKALGPESGQWIETLPRHGYRFSAPAGMNPAVMDPAVEPGQQPSPGFVLPYGRQLAAAVVVVAAGVFWARSRSIELPPATPLPITTLAGDELTPSLSPDGKDVAFVWNGDSLVNWDVYVKRAGVEEPLRFTSAEQTDFSPDWSPNGRQIAFARQLDSLTIDILLKPWPDGPERKVAQAHACVALGAPLQKILGWHPDGEHLVVSGVIQARHCGLSVLSTVTGAVTSLTEPPLPSVSDSAPAVSRDGRTLAFMRGSGWPTFLFTNCD
jgi:DNA-binding winged helix-turn-helix (wHTH) protein